VLFLFVVERSRQVARVDRLLAGLARIKVLRPSSGSAPSRWPMKGRRSSRIGICPDYGGRLHGDGQV
jgi:hypothetical protein